MQGFQSRQQVKSLIILWIFCTEQSGFSLSNLFEALNKFTAELLMAASQNFALETI